MLCNDTLDILRSIYRRLAIYRKTNIKNFTITNCVEGHGVVCHSVGTVILDKRTTHYSLQFLDFCELRHIRCCWTAQFCSLFELTPILHLIPH